MKTVFFLFPGLAAMLLSHSALADNPPFTGGRWVDLTHDFSEDTIYWPTAQGFKLEMEFRGLTPGRYFYAANRYRASEHGGTHIDAPIHFAADHPTVDQLPLEQ